MNYFFSDTIPGTNDAGFKARADVESILEKNGFIKLVNNLDNKKRSNNLINHFQIKNGWIKELESIKKGDSVVIQFPLAYRTIFFKSILKTIRKKGAKIIFLIHDLDSYRARSLRRRLRTYVEEGNIFNLVDKVIVHNDKMKELLVNDGVSVKKIVSLKIFDYLIDNNDFSKDISYGKELIVAGSLRKYKVGYLYQGPKKPQYNLYGVGYTADFPNLKYMGSFPPDELPFILKGSYGLIWDGDSLDTCSGPYGEYLRINNPHKTSLYLASGIPIVIWKDAALADFIVDNGVGIAIDSLESVDAVLNGISEERYNYMRKNVLSLSKKLRSGYFTMEAIKKCL